MPGTVRKSAHRHGILRALLPGARVDKNTKKIIVRVGSSNETITFNVGGTIFETFKSTLRTIPRSPLANEEFLARHFRPEKKDYFFDRDPEIFHCVLNYLRTGELHLPTSVCGPVVKSELEYWGVEEKDIEECCWSRYSAWASTLKALRKLEDDRISATGLDESRDKGKRTVFGEYRGKGWRFFSQPSSSCAAKTYSYVSLVIIFVSIFSFCAQTHEIFKVTEPVTDLNATAVSQTEMEIAVLRSATTYTSVPLEDIYSGTPGSHGSTDGEPDADIREVPHPALYFLDIACFFYFVLELFLRCLVSPTKYRFVTRPMTIVECTALLPDLIDMMVRVISSSPAEYHRVSSKIDFLKVLRVFRIFRLMKHIPGLWILFYTLKASVRDLLLLLLFVFVGMLVSSSLIYFAESREQKETFSSIPKCFWWAVVTMTTVGYGDMYPVTSWGYLIGAATGISGVLMIGFTVPVLVNNFIMYYNHTRSSISREKHRDSSVDILSNLHTLGSLKCFASMEELGIGERIIGLGSFIKPKDDKEPNENHRGSIGGIVFHVGSNDNRVLGNIMEPSNIADEDQH